MTSVALTDYYANQWNEAVAKARQKLSPLNERLSNKEVDSQQVRNHLDTIWQIESMQPAKHAISILSASFKHFEVAQELFVTNFPTFQYSHILWVLYNLMIKEATKPQEPSESLDRVASMMKNLGHRIALLNEYIRSNPESEQRLEANLDMYSELINFVAATVHFFQYGARRSVRPEQWIPLQQIFNDAAYNIDQIFTQVDRLLQLAKKAVLASDLSSQQALLIPSTGGFKDDAKLPCTATVPVVRNALFYDRESIRNTIDAAFFPASSQKVFRSFVLYGMGGVGKSHIALKYAHTKIASRKIDAILWFSSETENDLSFSFTQAAQALELPGTSGDRHSENRIILLNWLQHTSASWLLIFDNAENPDVLLNYWPIACAQGSILITSRNHNLQYGPADEGIEIPHFDHEDGSRLLLHLLKLDIIQEVSSTELNSAFDLSQRLDGHALAISFIAGLIQSKSWTISQFHEVYESNRRGVHAPRQKPNALTAIWQLSFDSLDASSAKVLGVLAYLHPDSVPEDILKRLQSEESLVSLRGPLDDLSFSELMEPLLTLALVKRDKIKRSFSIHRMVQTQYRYYLETQKRQEAFDNAVKLLDEGFNHGVFNHGVGQLYDRWATCQLHILQISSLRESYEIERKEPDPIQPTLQFCKMLQDCSRFLIEIADYTELEATLNIAKSAFANLSLDKRTLGIPILARLHKSTAISWGHRGKFSKGLQEIEESYQLEISRNPKDLESLSWVECNFSNLLASAGRYEEALQWQLKAESTRASINVQSQSTKSSAILHQNIARCYVFLNRPAEALNRLKLALEQLEPTQDWAMLAFTLFVKASLHQRQGELEQAKSVYMQSQKAWLDGGKMKLHHFNGACLYKLGCVSDSLGQTGEAVTFLHEALTIVKLKETDMPGDCLRVMHKLGQVKKRSIETHVEALDLELDLTRLLTQHNPNHRSARSSYSTIVYTPEDSPPPIEHDDLHQEIIAEEDRSYDDLVYILWR